MANAVAAPLTRERNTMHTAIDYAPKDAAVKDAVKIYNGAMIAAVAATGYAYPASDTANDRVLGVATETIDNSAAVVGHADGFVKVPYRVGVFAFDTGGDNAITIADLGKLCYVLDDHTVVRTGGTANSVIAGVVEGLDPDTGQVWVDTRRHSV